MDAPSDSSADHNAPVEDAETAGASMAASPPRRIAPLMMPRRRASSDEEEEEGEMDDSVEDDDQDDDDDDRDSDEEREEDDDDDEHAAAEEKEAARQDTEDHSAVNATQSRRDLSVQSILLARSPSGEDDGAAAETRAATRDDGADEDGDAAVGSDAHSHATPHASNSDGNGDSSASSHKVASSQQPKAKKEGRKKRKHASKDGDASEVSMEALTQLATRMKLDPAGLAEWSVRHDGKIVAPDKKKYRSMRDALRVYSFNTTGKIPRVDMYYLARLRRMLAEAKLPLVDGPVTVHALGQIVVESHFYTQKKLFPVGYETVATVQLHKPMTRLLQFRCKILNSSKNSPVFVVELESNPDIVFRSYVGSKAWKKALDHFQSLPADKFESMTVPAAELGSSNDKPLTADSEDGFGLLRRTICRVVEGLDQVLSCEDYRFWEERHVITVDFHETLRTRLRKNVKQLLKERNVPKAEIKRILSHDVIVSEQGMGKKELELLREQREKEERDKEKQSVREAARRLLQIEMKAQEDAKEAQRLEKEERKNAVIEAKKEMLRQREARKEAQRLAKEEERRMREEEKEMRRFLKEEERRKKIEEKELMMKKKIEELKQRKKLREEQKSILENGVVTTSAVDAEHNDTRLSPQKKSGDAGGDELSAPSAVDNHRQQQLALLKFVDEEKDRRHRIRVAERKNAIDKDIWAGVKRDFNRKRGSREIGGGAKAGRAFSSNAAEVLQTNKLSRCEDLDAIAQDLHTDLVFTWDFVCSFADCLKLKATPTLSAFVKILTLGDSSSPVGDGRYDEESLGCLFAGFHVEVIRVLIAEYFPMLQMGTTVDEFYRTRTVTPCSWPELARIVCLLALDVMRPSVDDHVIKSLKGSKSYRDDSVMLPLRQRLQKRGSDLLRGVKYQEGQGTDADVDMHSNGAREMQALVANSSFYGFVFDSCVLEVLELEDVEGNFVIKSILPNDVKREGSTNKKQIPSEVAVGHFVVCVNGHQLKDRSYDEISSLLQSTPAPHGVLFSKVAPPTKPPLKHIAMTLNSSKLKRCAHVLKILRSKEIATPFNMPVDGDLYPDYYTSGLISEPMDLGTIQEKMEDEDYENDDDVDNFIDDVNLVWKNCYTYNSVKSEISALARKLSAIFDRLMEEWVFTSVNRPMVSSDEELCRRCQTNQVKHQLLLCDRCDAPYHTFCMETPLDTIPSGEWFCPKCRADPKFSPDSFKKKAASESEPASTYNTSSNDEDLTELEKTLKRAVGILSRENYSDTNLSERIMVLRSLCELVQSTSVVQRIYQTLEEKSTELRRECGDALADLVREWEVFEPARSSSTIERTSKFIIDGVEHDLTDSLLNYLGEKARAELDGHPVPPIPVSTDDSSSLEKLELETTTDEEDSDEDEQMLLEVFGDGHLAASCSRGGDVATLCAANEDTPPIPDVCAFCGLEDRMLHGELKWCKRSPLTQFTTLLEEFELPKILEQVDSDSDFLSCRRVVSLEDFEASVRQTTDGFEWIDKSSNVVPQETHDNINHDRPKYFVYALNDQLVTKMSGSELMSLVRGSGVPMYVYVSSLPPAALDASVSILKHHTRAMGVSLSMSESRPFVKTLELLDDGDCGFAELSRQVFPGDMLLLINDQPVVGKSVEELEAIVNGVSDPRYFVVVRPPSPVMKAEKEKKYKSTYSINFQRELVYKLRSQLRDESMNQPRNVTTTRFDVVFQPGPLGLALALDNGRVSVKSLNDMPDGTLGQASLSGQIQCGDLVERVNGETYTDLRDLSQFTSFLLRLPRPLVISFAREEQSPNAMWTQPNLAELKSRYALAADDELKTVRVAPHCQLPFLVEQVGLLHSVIKADGVVCERNTEGDSVCCLRVGDMLVGINGHSVEGLRWSSIMMLVSDQASPVMFHFVAFARESTLVKAHEHCAQVANVAWLEAESLLPKIEQATKLEQFVSSIVPRSSILGKCRSGYTYYRFFGDRLRLYVVYGENRQWLCCQTQGEFETVLNYLRGHDRDTALASRIKVAFHHCIHGIKKVSGEVPCCEYSQLSYVVTGPFAIQKELTSVATEFQTERHECIISYFGRKYALGSFGERNQAEMALREAERVVKLTGNHLHTSVVQMLPRLPVPVLKADGMIRRTLGRRYEYPNATVDVHGHARSFPLCQSVYQVIRRGMRVGVPITASPDMQPRAYPVSTVPPRILDTRQQAPLDTTAMKRKVPTPTAEAAFEMQKRARLAAGHPPTMAARQASPILNHPNHPGAPGMHSGGTPGGVKRSFQSLVDQARVIIAAWNSFTGTQTPQAASALAAACVAGFEEVKKAVSKVLMEPQGGHPDRKTFVCLHHAYVAGLTCAMASQAHSKSKRSPGDQSLLKMMLDAFTAAILSCADSSTAHRVRAMKAFAAAITSANPSHRQPDMSDEMHHMANFLLQFARTTKYLDGDDFGDTSRCRPIFSTLARGVESLPASFLQQVRLVEKVREAFEQKLDSAGSHYRGHPHKSMAPDNAVVADHTNRGAAVDNDSEFIHATFHEGPLGIVINYSGRGTIIVTEFSSDHGMMGQAQASGKVMLGDEVYAVNDNLLAAIGMEGFKSAVASGIRPLKVTFRRLRSARQDTSSMAPTNLMPTAAQEPDTSVGKFAMPTPSQGFPSVPPNNYNEYSTGVGGESGSYYASSVNPIPLNQPMPTPYIHQQQQQETPPMGAYPASSGLAPSQFTSSSGQPTPTGPMPGLPRAAPYNLSPLVGGMQPYQGGEVLPTLYDDNQASGGGWQAPMKNYDESSAMPTMGSYGAGTTGGNMQGPAYNEGGAGNYPTPLPIRGMPARPGVAVPSEYQAPNNEQYVNFIAPNDPNVSQDDSNMPYYGNNGPTFRGPSTIEFVAGDNAPSETELSLSNLPTQVASDNEEDSDLSSQRPPVSELSLSNLPTPVASDNEAESESIPQRVPVPVVPSSQAQHASANQHAPVEPSANTESTVQQDPVRELASSQVVQSPNATQNVVQSSLPSVDPAQHQVQSNSSNEEQKHEEGIDGMSHAALSDLSSRRSSRVSKKVTTNIGDQYDPELAKGHQERAFASARGVNISEPTHGEVGELATELLEPFVATIRPAPTAGPHSLALLRAQLLMIEAAIPRDAFRQGRWSRAIRAAWAELVYSSETSHSLLEAILFVESNIEAEYLDPCWKASFLQTAKNALANSTIASAAMRLYALDDAITYVRAKRTGKRKTKSASGSGSHPSSPTANERREIVLLDDAPTHASELPFLSKLPSNVMTLSMKIINRILSSQKEKTMNAFGYRKAKTELRAITSLTEGQVEQWIKTVGYQAQQQLSGSRGLSVVTSGPTSSAHQGPTSTSSRANATPKRRQNTQTTPTSNPRPSRKRKTAAFTQQLEINCFQMQTAGYQFHNSEDRTLKSRLEFILTNLLANELALPFSAPVNPRDAPGYTDIIKHPCDLGTVKTRLMRGIYDNRYHQLTQDVNLVWQNCFTYNRLDSEISKSAIRLRSVFNRFFEQWITGVAPGTPVTELASEEQCRTCRQMNATDSMLLCDSCDAAYHLFCLTPPLQAIPSGNWFCPRCPLQKLTN